MNSRQATALSITEVVKDRSQETNLGLETQGLQTSF